MKYHKASRDWVKATWKWYALSGLVPVVTKRFPDGNCSWVYMRKCNLYATGKTITIDGITIDEWKKIPVVDYNDLKLSEDEKTRVSRIFEMVSPNLKKDTKKP